jgi:hypothetical protein
MRHVRTFYGRPKSQVTTLREYAERGKSKTARKVDLARERAEKVLTGLPGAQRAVVEEYLGALQDQSSVAGLALALDWFLGAGLSQMALRKFFDTEWAEELVDPWGGRP